MIEEITIKFGTEFKPTQHCWKSQLYTFFVLKKKKKKKSPCFLKHGYRSRQIIFLKPSIAFLLFKNAAIGNTAKKKKKKKNSEASHVHPFFKRDL